MKQKLLKPGLLRPLMLMLILLGIGGGKIWGETVTETINFSQKGYSNGEAVSSSAGTNTLVTFTDGSTATAYYDTGTGIRIYGGGSATFTAGESTITKVVLTFSGTSYAPSARNVWKPNEGVTISELYTTWEGSSSSVSITRPSGSGHWRLQKVSITYEENGSATSTCATPNFSLEAGTYIGSQNVTISSSTDGATIYYTTDGNDPTTASSVYSAPIAVSETKTIKAMAVKEGMENSAVATAAYTIKPAVSGLAVDFENELDCYVDWTFSNIARHSGTISSHNGSRYGSNANDNGNSVTTAYIRTKEKVAYPDVFTCYISKESTNTTSSNWKIQVSSDGMTWADIASTSATSMTKGEWIEFSCNIRDTNHKDVYVRLSYDGSAAARAVDDITLTTYTPAAVEAPSIAVSEEFTFSTTAAISCITEGAKIYYSFDNSTWTEYTEELTINATTTIYAKAVKGSDESTVVQKTATKVLATPEVTISATSFNIGATAAVSTTGPSVTLTTSDAAIASVSGASVTGVAEGTATITATWAANNDYAAGTKDFLVTITDPNQPGASAENPYTVAQALAASPGAEVYVQGVVCEIVSTSVNSNGQIRYYISADGSNDGEKLNVFNGKGLNGANFTDINDILVGDQVIVYGTLSVYSGANQMAANNYIVSLTRPTHVVSFYVNGAVISSAEVAEHAAIVFPTNAPADINGKTFMGWTTEAIASEQDEAPTMVTGATMGSADVNYYAVFATAGAEGSTTATLTSTNIKDSYAGGNSYKARSITSSDGKIWNAYAMSYRHGNDYPNDYYLQIKKYDSQQAYFIQVPEYGTQITSLTMTVSGASAPKPDGGNNSTVYFSADNTTSAANAGVVSGTGSSSITLDCSSLNLNTGYITASGAVRIWDVEVTYTATSYSGYCTTVLAPYTRTVSEGAWGTICLNRDATVEGATVYSMSGVTLGSDGKPTSVALEEATQMEGGKAYLFKATSSQLVARYVAGSTAVASPIVNGGLVGVYERTNVPLNCYVMQNNEFHKCVYKEGVTSGPTDVTVAANRAYLDLAQATIVTNPGQVKVYIPFHDVATAVQEMKGMETKAEIFDLAGRRVQKATKGIYIVNGRKVAVK